jgi:hypothetical protein
MGMLSYPFWFFFEWLAPLVELSGVVFMICQLFLGNLNIPFAILLLSAVYAFSFMISMTGLLAEEFSYHPYRRKRDILKLVFTALIEPLVFHPRVVWWSIRGNIDLIKGKKAWGDMSRQGFVRYKKKVAA